MWTTLIVSGPGATPKATAPLSRSVIKRRPAMMAGLTELADGDSVATNTVLWCADEKFDAGPLLDNKSDRRHGSTGLATAEERCLGNYIDSCLRQRWPCLRLNHAYGALLQVFASAVVRLILLSYSVRLHASFEASSRTP